MQKMKYFIALCFVLTTLISFTQTTVGFNSSGDAYTTSVLPTSNFSTMDSINVRVFTVASTTHKTRGYVTFNLSSIPSNAIITAAGITFSQKGNDGLGTGSSSALTLDLVNTTWTESGVNYNSNLSNNTMATSVTTSNYIAGFSTPNMRAFDVTAHVQALVELRIPNYGWQLRRSNETTVATSVYYSKESSYPPQLSVTYYIPASVSSATVTHESFIGAADGGVSPTIVNGASGTKSYRWYNSAGTLISSTQNLTGVGYGWYGLKVYSTTAGDTLYNAFIVGAQCEEVNISFTPGTNYMDDAQYYNLTSGSGTTIIDYKQQNNGTLTSFYAENWQYSSVWSEGRSLLKFKLWVDPALSVTQATMTLYGNGHNPSGRANTSELVKVTSNWRENGVAYNNAPTSSTSVTTSVPSVAAGNNPAVLNVANFFNDWKTNNTLNYGMLLRLTLYNNSTATRQQYYSSESASKPTISFKFSLTSTCDITKTATTTVTTNSATTTGSIAFNLGSPTWTIAPYKYIVSELPIPEMSKTYKFLKDSIYGGVLDSAAYFQGPTNTTTYTVNDLPTGKYYTAVFDSRGKRVFSKTVEVQLPITFTSNPSSYLTATGTTITSSNAAGLGELAYYSDPETLGQFQFTPNNLTGNQAYGIIEYKSTLSSVADLKYGFKFTGSTLSLINSATVTSFTAAAGKTVGLTFLKDTIIYTYGDSIVGMALPAANTEFKVGVVMNAASKISFLAFKKPIFAFGIHVTSPVSRDCNSSTSNLTFTSTKFNATSSTTMTYTLVDNNQSPAYSYSSGTVNTGTITSPVTQTVSNVPPGVYTLTTNIGGTIFSKTVYVGVQVEWFPDHPNYNLLPNTYSLSRDVVDQGTYSKAVSVSNFAAAAKGWTWFDPVVTASPFKNNTNYYTFLEGNTNLLPATTETYLSFSKSIPFISFPSGTITPGGMLVSWTNHPTPSQTYYGSAVVPNNAHITTKLTGTLIYVYANDVLIAILNQPTGAIRIKANSKRNTAGFKNVHFTLPCARQTSALTSYYELKRDYTAGYAIAVERKLKFTFDEEYSIASGKYLTYTIYSDDNTTPVGSSNSAGVTTGGAMAVPYVYDDNRYIMDLPALTPGKYYHLEVMTSTGEKRVLRFLFKY